MQISSVVLGNGVRRIYQGVIQFNSVIRYHGTRVIITSFIAIRKVVPSLIFKEARNGHHNYLDVLLTVHLSIILVIDQLNGQILVL